MASSIPPPRIPSDLELARMQADWALLEQELRAAGYAVLAVIHDETQIQAIEGVAQNEEAFFKAWLKFSHGRLKPIPIIPVSTESVLFMDWAYDKKGTP